MLRRVTVQEFDYHPHEDENDVEVVDEFVNEDGIMDEETLAFSERTWRRSYLKDQFAVKELDGLFDVYTHKINHGYISTYLILQIILMTTHFLIVLSLNMDSLDVVTLDLTLYGLLLILPIFGLFISEKYIKDHPKLLFVISAVAFLLLFLTNILVPLYHHFLKSEQLRPVYTTLLIISCYVFFHVTSNIMAVSLGLFVTFVHILILIFITYSSSLELPRIGSDIIFFICLNGFGLYFRLITEIIKMRSFIDRRACVESTVTLKAEKEQGEKLMLSIIPKFIMDDVIHEIYDFVKNGRLSEINYNRRIKQYDNVTILYADIVNYTQMTSTLRSIRLVETLHDLFGRFDEASQELQVQRIKFLGDCYYCVAGLTEDEAVDHADACVELGLRMIEIIQHVREKCGLDINMRIGVHTGSIMGGIIGSTKYQFDIWSKDVYIANRMETTGQAGKVHITNQTRVQLKKRYAIVPSDAGLRDAELLIRDIQCYLISPEIDEVTVPQAGPSRETNIIRQPILEGLPNDSRRNGSILSGRRESLFIQAHRRSSFNPNMQNGRNSRPYRRRYTPGDASRRTPFMDSNLSKYHERLEETDRSIQDAVASMPLSKSDQWFKIKDIQPFFLFFKNLKVEMDFIKIPDPLFKYYILSDILILICVVCIQNISQTNWDTIVGYISILFVLFIILPISWIHGVWKCYKYKENNPNSVVKNLYSFSELITKNVIVRIGIYLVVCMLCAGTVFSEMIHCEHFNRNSTNSTGKSLSTLILNILYRTDAGDDCMIPWHITETFALIIIINFSFMRIHLWLKMFVASFITALFSYFMWIHADEYYTNSEYLNISVGGPVAHIIGIIYLTVTLHFIDRQTDYMNRLDHKWKVQLSMEQEEAHILHDVNNKLLNNILPLHVAEYYMDGKRQAGLYYEEYTERQPVAVMFASIENYDRDMPDQILLEFLGGIITSFDQILLSKYDNVVEKIKVANWTYMAAVGLDPGKRVSYAEGRTDRVHVVINMLKFAADIKKQIKREDTAFQDCKLRIGICHGPITAGVVGSKKPLYDIWGDPVNMASRMESTGVIDRIQVPHETAIIIQNYGYACTFRGNIFVKGKPEKVPTYFVEVDENDDLIKI